MTIINTKSTLKKSKENGKTSWKIGEKDGTRNIWRNWEGKLTQVKKKREWTEEVSYCLVHALLDHFGTWLKSWKFIRKSMRRYVPAFWKPMKNSFEDLYSISTNLKVVSSEDSKTSCGPEAIKTRRRQGEAEYKGHGRARALIKQNKKKEDSCSSFASNAVHLVSSRFCDSHHFLIVGACIRVPLVTLKVITDSCAPLGYGPG